MNQDALQVAAERLRQVAESLIANGHPEVEMLLEGLRPLIDQALSRSITSEVPWGKVPGRWLMSETPIRELPGLEDAYAAFKIELTGGETPVLRQLKEAKGNQ